MEAIIVNIWPTRNTPDVIQPIPFTPQMTVARAVALLRHARDIPQPTNTPLPPDVSSQFPRYYLIAFNGRLLVEGVKRDLSPTKCYAVFDIDSVVEHGYWHPQIINNILAVLETLIK